MGTSEVLEHQLEQHSRASTDRWKTIKYALDDWQRTLRLCLILFVATGPLDVVLYAVMKHFM